MGEALAKRMTDTSITVKVNRLKWSPYAYRGTKRVDPTEQGDRHAREYGRYSACMMKDYNAVRAEIAKQATTAVEEDLLMQRYHNERVAELVRTKDAWLGKGDAWPITVNQFNEVIEGNHRIR